MTKDVIALTSRMPDPWAVLAGLLSGGPDKLVGTRGEGAVIQLCDAEGRPLVSVEAPLLVSVEGEAERLLGTTAPPVPYWWTEARATTGVAEAEALAGTFAARLATLVGGSAWPSDAAGSIAVVKTDGVSVAPEPAADRPAIDVLTGKVAVVIQDRPVVAMTAWLSDAFRAAAEAGLGLQIVSPAGTMLSPAVRDALGGWPSRWIVQDERDGYYDGLTGAVMRWQDGAFDPVLSPDATEDDPHTPVAAAYREVRDTGERQLGLTFRMVHPADERLVLGGGLETVWRELTGEPCVRLGHIGTCDPPLVARSADGRGVRAGAGTDLARGGRKPLATGNRDRTHHADEGGRGGGGDAGVRLRRRRGTSAGRPARGRRGARHTPPPPVDARTTSQSAARCSRTSTLRGTRGPAGLRAGRGGGPRDAGRPGEAYAADRATGAARPEDQACSVLPAAGGPFGSGRVAGVREADAASQGGVDAHRPQSG